MAATGKVGGERLELSRVLPHRILSPACLPISATARDARCALGRPAPARGLRLGV